MKQTVLFLALAALSPSIFSTNASPVSQEIKILKQQVSLLEKQLSRLEKKTGAEEPAIGPHNHKSTADKPKSKVRSKPERPQTKPTHFHAAAVTVHSPELSPEGSGYYPTALMSDNQIITFIAGTPVVTAPYLGARPAFDGSDYIVNISSINRDIRLMQQRRKLYRAYEAIGYPKPDVPIIALSGKSEPIITFSKPTIGNSYGDINLGSNELDTAAVLNQYVEAFMALAFDASPPSIGYQRVANSNVALNLGFVNIGDLDRSPFYFTAGQLYAPFGRYSSSMISAPISLNLARTKTRPFILGYKSQADAGPYVAVYGFVTDTNLGHDGTGGLNVGYAIAAPHDIYGDVGFGFIGSLNDSQSMQFNGTSPSTNAFAGFGAPIHGSEFVKAIPGVNVHGNIGFDRYSLTAEWVGATEAFRVQDLSFNGHGAKPQAGQLEFGVTFRAFDKPASIGVGYQWSKEALALNLPQNRLCGVFNISIWKDTVESLEFRHDENYGTNNYANGASAPGVVNANTIGSGLSVNTIIGQVGVYF